MTSLRVCSLVLLGLFCSSAVLHSVEAHQTTLLFAFGDAYVDVGNTPKTGNNTGRAWKTPYGISWPSSNGSMPAGRYSDGKTQTDWIKDLLNLPVYPPPYLYSEGMDISSGVNFAAGGSGVSLASNPTSLGAQVDNFERLLHTGAYSEGELLNSLTIVSVQVDDYLTFMGESLVEFYVYIQRVTNGIQENLQRLYDLGLRNVMVPNVLNVDCSPLSTVESMYMNCTVGDAEPYIKIHNAFLLGVVQSINALNPGARFIVLDEFAAMNKLIQDATALGFTDGLMPCCAPTTNTSMCGDVDPATGEWLYTVCKRRAKAIFWDELRPTMYAWNYIINLYANEPGYIMLADAPTLKQWLQINDNTEESAGAPYSPPDETTAIGQLAVVMHELLDFPQYSEALGLLGSFDLDAELFGEKSQVVTIFLPTNDALTDPASRPFIDKAFYENNVNEAALYHVASGYYDLQAITTSKPASVATLSGLQLPLSYLPTGVFVGTNAQAQVIEPNVYNEPGKLVIHGINHVLMPPGF